MGLQSLPVAFGVETAKWITVGTIDVTQAAVAAYLFFGLDEPLYGAILTALILPQVLFSFSPQHTLRQNAETVSSEIGMRQGLCHDFFSIVGFISDVDHR